MKKMLKKSLAAVLAVLMLLSVVPFASAQEISNPFDMDRLYEALEECYSRADKHTLKMLGITSDMDIKLMSTEEETLTSGMFTYTVSDNGEATITGLVFDKVTENIVIPNTIDGYAVTDIADAALTTYAGNLDFGNVPVVKSIHIGRYIKNVGSFINCTLEKITVESSNQYYSSINGVLYDKTGQNLIFIPAATKINSITVNNAIDSADDFLAVLYCAYTGASVAEMKFTNSFINSFYSFVMSEFDTPTGAIEPAYMLGIKDKYEYADFYFRLLLKAVKVDKFVVPSENNHLSTDSFGALYNKSKTILIKYPIGSTAKLYSLPETVDLSKLHGSSNASLVGLSNSPFIASAFSYTSFELLTMLLLYEAFEKSGMFDETNEESMAKATTYINWISDVLANMFFEKTSSDLRVHVPDKVMETLPADQILPSESQETMPLHNLTGAKVCVSSNVTLDEIVSGTLASPATVTYYNECVASFVADSGYSDADFEQIKKDYPDISEDVIINYADATSETLNQQMKVLSFEKFEICNNNHSVNYKIFGREFNENLDYYAKKLDSSNYDPVLSNMMAALSKAVYTEKDIKEACRSLGFEYCEVFDYETSTAWNECGYSMAFKKSDYSDDVICLISVRGSQELAYNADWIGNIVISTGFDQKHDGFAKPANNIYSNIQNYIKANNITGNIKYFVTGHSRGAAVANLLSVKLMENGVRSSNIYNYNYACPDVACMYVFPSFNNIFNLCNRADVVPLLPGNLFSLGTSSGTSWGKFGRIYWFTQSVSEHENLADTLIANHDMGFYLEFFDQQLAPDKWGASYEDKIIDAANDIIGWVTKIMCPVDVIITDKDGNEIASVINGEVNYYDSTFGEVIILTDGDKKVIYINGDKDFNVKLIGTDDGEMTFSVERYNLQTEEVLESKTFDNVALEKGKEMYSPVSDAENTDEVKLFVVDDGDITHRITEDGTEIDYSWVNEHVFEMKSPSTATIKYGDTLVLQADLGETALPEGWSIRWDVDGTGFNMTPAGDGLTCNMTSVANGNATVKATLVDETGEVVLNAEGNEISAEITLKSNASFWQKIVSFFKNLFRINRIIY